MTKTVWILTNQDSPGDNYLYSTKEIALDHLQKEEDREDLSIVDKDGNYLKGSPDSFWELREYNLDYQLF